MVAAGSAVVATDRRKCETCGDGYLGTARSKYCKPACRQKAARGRRPTKTADRNAKRNAKTVTVPAAAAHRERAQNAHPAHCAEAMAVLDGLDVELAASAKRAGRPMGWSTADTTLRELIASTIDRRTGLQRLYEAATDPALALRLSAELRLLEASIARLLKQVKIAMPAAQSKKSQKASQAAHARWDRSGA